jgi:hypothetical protein
MKNLLPLLLCAAVAGTGCMHTNTVLPGVLDLRSDGSTATVNKDKVEVKGDDVKRDGFGAIMSGDGLQIEGEKVRVEDRNWHLLGLIHVINDHGEAEFAALPKTGALKNVHVGDRLAGTDVVIAIVPYLLFFIPIWNPFGILAVDALPRMTMELTGTRIQGQAGPVEPPPPTDGTTPVAPPVAEPAPLAPEKK